MEDWVEATNILQKLMQLPEDAWAEITEGSGKKKATRIVSVRSEARRLVLALPAKGREFYAIIYGPTAASMLKEARAERNIGKLERIVRCFPITPAAAAAQDEIRRLRAQPGGPPVKTALRQPEQQDADASSLGTRWRHDTAQQAETVRILHEAAHSWQMGSFPRLSASVPLVATASLAGRATPVVIYRGPWGIHMVELRTGRLCWETPSDWGLDRLTRDAYKSTTVARWINYYQQVLHQSQLLRNSTVATLSTDGNQVYAVEDLPLPPPQLPDADSGRVAPLIARFRAAVRNAFDCNRLQAFDLTTGKLRWRLGGKSRPGQQPGVLEDAFFLGPPLPLGSRLYVLVERKGRLGLVCLSPARGEVLSVQTLARPGLALPADSNRRTWAARPVFADGILVCPTNAGAVVGVEPLSNTLVWAHVYKESKNFRTRPSGITDAAGKLVQLFREPEWNEAGPLLVSGKVLLTAPDSDRLLCLDLKTGQEFWSRPRQETDLYVAGVQGGKVLVVGQRRLSRLSLAGGETLWTLPTRTPAGRGVLHGTRYYLPLRDGTTGGAAGICVIDVDRGRVAGHIRTRNRETCGNLVFAEGVALSQTAVELVALDGLAGLLRRRED